MQISNLSSLTERAESGDIAAQVELGKVYLAQEKFGDACVWLHRAAEAENAEAQCLYGSLLAEGLGVDQDEEAAAYWLLKSAQQGNSGAQVLLAQSFESGSGVPTNRGAAATWYLKAAEQGDHIAQFRYGQLLFNGDGVGKDLPQAADWLRTAAEGGCLDAAVQLIECLLEIQPYDVDAIIKWCQIAGDAGDAKAQYLFGWTLENFFDINHINQAVAWYRKSAEQGYTDAAIRLGKLYAEGKIVAQDQTEAEKWLSMVVASDAPKSREMVEANNAQLQSISSFVTVNEYPPGSIIDQKYFIMSVLGKGGMCMVYKAKHLLMNKMVALKMLLPESASDKKLVERFRREAEAASKLNHPNVITIYDLGISPDGKPFMVMDFLEGESLEERIGKEGCLPIPQLISFFMQICNGLEVAHEAGIIHRDIKPSNIMLVNTKTQTDLVKVVDFGLAKMFEGEEGAKLTQTGEVFGTLMYMSPEQCLGHPLDPRTDVYSVGCAMYECATGFPPFRGNTPFELMNKHINVPAEPLPPELPPQLNAIIQKAIAKNREDRYASMSALRDDLLAFMSA